jgi:hypothetical protein
VARPGRQAGIKRSRKDERRRRGTLTLNAAYPSCLPSKTSAVRKDLANPTRGICLERIHQVGDGDSGWQGHISMNVIRLAIDFDQPCVPGACNRIHISMEALPPLLVNEIPAPFGAPNNVRKYGKKFSCHIVSNLPGYKLIEKISSICAAPSALVSFGDT